MATSASSAARTLADVLTGRAEVAYAVHGGMVTLESPAWPGVEVVYERASRRPSDGSWVVSWQGGPTQQQMRGYVEAAAEWIGTGRPLRGVRFGYRRDVSDAMLLLALDRAIGGEAYSQDDLDEMAGESGWARSAAEYAAAQTDLSCVTTTDLAEYEQILDGRDAFYLGWVVPLLRARHVGLEQDAVATSGETKSRDGSPLPSRVDCVYCAGPLPEGARADARTCSHRCRQAAHRARAAAKVTKPRDGSCGVCGAGLPSVQPRRAGRMTVYCSHACRQAAYRRRRRELADRDENA